uniref:Receptor ligand binding region domain-containing protein n=1 Tax=Aegilops tauschii subsp. strangulata TaxID=200361 RepID=A0A453KVW4_AEGTS
WRRVVPIYQDDDYGAAFVPFLVDALTAERTEVPYRCALPAAALHDAIAAALLRMESEQTRVFVLHTRPELAKKVFAAAVDTGMMAEGYVWIITDGLTGLLGSVDPPQGVIGLTPYVPDTTRLRGVKKRWAHRYMRDHRDAEPAQAVMGCYALWAYDAAWAVASAAERLSSGDLSSPPGLVGGKGGPTDIAGLGKSTSGLNFLRAINSTKFDGLGGKFELVNGELAVPAFQVVNIMDNGRERGIGFWTLLHGLSRHGSNESRGELGPVIWPGDSTVRPTGWVQPTSARKLRVAVPGNVSDSYKPIVRLEVDPATNQTTASGFVIEVFEAAVRLLPYALPFEYVKAASMPYDDLVQAVGNGDVRRGGGGHHHDGEPVEPRGLHAALRRDGHRHVGAGARPTEQQANMGLPQAAPLRPLARQRRLFPLHRLRGLGHRAPRQPRVPRAGLLPGRHAPLLRLLHPRLRPQGDAQEQPLQVRGARLGLRGAHPAVQLHGEPHVHAHGAAAGAGRGRLRRAAAGHGDGRGHEQLLRAQGHDGVRVPAGKARAVPELA